MQLEFTKTGKSFAVKDTVGAILLKRGLARWPVDAADAARAMKAESDAEISAVTGLPKRAYRRRDMKAQD